MQSAKSRMWGIFQTKNEAVFQQINSKIKKRDFSLSLKKYANQMQYKII
jgi:hypothetical protein